MSAKNVKAFVEAMRKDKSLQAKLRAIDKAEAAAAAGEAVKLASAAGFKFTAKEFSQARTAQAKKMAATQLADVSGQHYCTQGMNGWYGDCYW